MRHLKLLFAYAKVSFTAHIFFMGHNFFSLAPHFFFGGRSLSRSRQKNPRDIPASRFV
jgi:hypothetical protein